MLTSHKRHETFRDLTYGNIEADKPPKKMMRLGPKTKNGKKPHHYIVRYMVIIIVTGAQLFMIRKFYTN